MNLIKRLGLEIAGLIALLVLLFILGFANKAETGLALFMYKALLFSASQIHAMLARKLLFPYIHFSSPGLTGEHLMVVALHVMAAYVYSQGG